MALVFKQLSALHLVTVKDNTVPLTASLSR